MTDKSSIEIVDKGIVDIAADAIVNAANGALQEGGGVCGVIFAKAGPEQLQAACDKIGRCDTGSAVITPAFGCPAKYIIHAVGPVWSDGSNGEREKLYGAYKKSLELCKENGIRSVVFPLISAGIFGCPVKDAWEQAIYACKNFMNANPDYKIRIVFAIPAKSADGRKKFDAGNEILSRELPASDAHP